MQHDRRADRAVVRGAEERVAPSRKTRVKAADRARRRHRHADDEQRHDQERPGERQLEWNATRHAQMPGAIESHSGTDSSSATPAAAAAAGPPADRELPPRSRDERREPRRQHRSKRLSGSAGPGCRRGRTAPPARRPPRRPPAAAHLDAAEREPARHAPCYGSRQHEQAEQQQHRDMSSTRSRMIVAKVAVALICSWRARK